MNAKVLIVDDDAALLQLLEYRLIKAGYSVLSASSGEEAVCLALGEKPPIIITDWSMPGMNGLELCRVLRSLEDLHFVYIIMLTAHSEEERMVEAFDAGADDFLHKPVSSQELLARLKAAMRIVQLENDLDHQNRSIRKVNSELISLNHRLEDLAKTDSLTGLPNRREAMLTLNSLWQRRQGTALPLGCMLVDIDHFKILNDRCGHDFGDQALRETAQCLSRMARASDTVARIGGEEFLVLCPDQPMDMTIRAAEAMCRELRGSTVMHNGQETVVTVSIGVSEYDASMATADELLRRADTALYAAKRAGRNQVQVAARGLTPPSEQVPSLERIAHAGRDEEAANHPTHVLVVDDDATVRRLCRRFLESSGYRVTEAEDGLDALARVSTCRPDIIVMDRMMPRLDGIDCSRQLKADPRTRDVPIIMASASGEEVDVVAGLEAGADEYIQKPIRRREFVLRVGSMAALYRSKLKLMQACDLRDEQSRVLTMLLDFSAGLTVTRELEVALEKTVALTSKLLNSRNVSLMLPDPECRYLTIAKSVGIDPELAASVRIPPGEGIAGDVFACGAPIVMNEANSVFTNRSRYATSVFASLPLVSHPLVGPDHVIGVLNVTGREGDLPFQPRELKYIQLITTIAAATIDDIVNRQARDVARDSIVGALATLVEYRDTDTRKHMDRVTSFALVLAEELRQSSHFSHLIDDAFLYDLQRAVPLHDIGKVAVPDQILLKPGKLTADELRWMRRHAEIGASAIRSVIARVPGVRFLKMAEQIACSHHEGYDGSGYPHRLKGEEIPLAARLTALADVYDAITTRRVYKEALSHQTAVEIIRQSSGAQFDPGIVEAFLRREEAFERIAAELADESIVAPKSAEADSLHLTAKGFSPHGAVHESAEAQTEIS